MDNIILSSDIYKTAAREFYPPQIKKVYAHLEATTSARFPEMVFFGLQYYLRRYLAGQVVTKEKIDEAENLINPAFQNEYFRRQDWEYIVEKHDGKLPIVIKALPEGMVFKRGNVILTVENTDPECFWLISFLEPILLKIWYTITIASQTRNMKAMILNELENTCEDHSMIDFKIHDCGMKDSYSFEQSGLAGCAHLVNFKASNNPAGIHFAEKYYDTPQAGYSIPIVDYHPMMIWNQKHEQHAYTAAMKAFPTGMVAVSGDTYDAYKSLKEVVLKELTRPFNLRDGTILFRPAHEDAARTAHQSVEMIGRQFGSTLNLKGFKVLRKGLGVIQTLENEAVLKKILGVMSYTKWCISNLYFSTRDYQEYDRSDYGFRYKPSWMLLGDKEADVSKKGSRPGRFKVISENGTMKSIPENSEGQDLLQEVFCDGEIMKQYTLEEIRLKAFLE